MEYKTLKYFKSITLILSIAKIHENCILELANGNKFVKYRALENNQLYSTTLFTPHLEHCMQKKGGGGTNLTIVAIQKHLCGHYLSVSSFAQMFQVS